MLKTLINTPKNMGIAHTELASKIIKQTSTEFGITHFINNVVVIEFNEGTHIDLKAVKPILNNIKSHYGSTKPFGIVANRINSYSISILDLNKARQIIPNLAAYGIVSYNKATQMNAQIESSVCQWKDICFDNLFEGFNTIQKRVENQTLINSN
ncbi:hypothetical protein [Winogradskyella sp.]|jgi:hypothetical protein|uniref:hypothetical protein n=1 Tax=Winogradskyella sp. TaxID=1883156 RepID=UPI0025D7DCC1|nr:hypothetical protein [Winogradskyella sp.]MCT4630925.1 hypothetical protein [Winogradskyella sp.]